MMGEKVQDVNAKITGTRVLPGELGPKVEASFAGTGTLLGVATTELGTYVSTMTPAGVLNGEGQGITMTADGDSIAWKGHGVGKPTGKGMAAAYRYSIVVQTTSQKFAKLNGILLIGEWEVDENGHAKGQAWEWR